MDNETISYVFINYDSADEKMNSIQIIQGLLQDKKSIESKIKNLHDRKKLIEIKIKKMMN